VKRALALLQLDRGQSTPAIAANLMLSAKAVWQIGKRYQQEGVERALFDAPRPGKTPALNQQQQQRIVAVVCSPPPEGRALSGRRDHSSDRRQPEHTLAQGADGPLRREGWRLVVGSIYGALHAQARQLAQLGGDRDQPVGRQCLGGRKIGDIRQLRRQAKAWNRRANRDRIKIDWRFTRKRPTET